MDTWITPPLFPDFCVAQVLNTSRNLVLERLPGITGGTATGMIAPLLTVGAAAGGCGGGRGNLAESLHFEPTTHAAFWGSLAGSTTYGTVLAHAAYKAAGSVINRSMIAPAFQGWGIGGTAGAAGMVGVVALGEAAHHAYKSHTTYGEQQRIQNDPEIALPSHEEYVTAPEPAVVRSNIA